MSFEKDFFKALRETEFNFEEMALQLFRHQAEHVFVYKEFLKLLNVDTNDVVSLKQIPFLPVSFFKKNKIIAGDADDSFYFESSASASSKSSLTAHPTSPSTSSGTVESGSPIRSKHYVPDLKIYEWSFKNGFNTFYPSYKDFCVLGLLPSYLERGSSSLVYMVDQFIKESNYPKSNFFLNNFEALHKQLLENERMEIPTLLIGVTYALIDFAEQYPMPLKNTIVMETGGMKGRRKEMVRSEVHNELKKAFSLTEIHSEYGMTELLSQGYSEGHGIFNCPPWMRIYTADLNDARTILPKEKAGSINIIDLGNIYSCAFIATDDLGIVHADDSFEILGRKDNSDVRGCGLMYSITN